VEVFDLLGGFAMVRGVFSVFDSKANAFLSVFSLVNKGVAVRWFSGMVNGGHLEMTAHPEDFTLFQLANFDEDSGSIEPLGSPKSIVLGVLVVKKEGSR